MNQVQKPDETEESIRQFVNENYYKVRDCKMYELEYNECKSIRGRFHQYYLNGETLDCSKWEEDLKNCRKSEYVDDIRALAAIIHHENERLEKRLRSSQENDVWKKRSEPPANWNSELPEWLTKRQNNSFFHQKDTEDQGCIIS